MVDNVASPARLNGGGFYVGEIFDVVGELQSGTSQNKMVRQSDCGDRKKNGLPLLDVRIFCCCGRKLACHRIVSWRGWWWLGTLERRVSSHSQQYTHCAGTDGLAETKVTDDGV